MINKIAPDKWRHFFVGIAMGTVLQALLLFLLSAHHSLATLITFLLIIAISYGFELTSKFTHRGHYDLMDAVASIIGGMLGIGLVSLFKMESFSV
jgi:glycopeptide antibiotics resistance protein